MRLLRVEELAKPGLEPQETPGLRHRYAYLLIAAAQLDGLLRGEDFSEHLQEVLGRGHGVIARTPFMDVTEQEEVACTVHASCTAAAGLLHPYLARLRRREGRYDEALVQYERMLSRFRHITRDFEERLVDWRDSFGTMLHGREGALYSIFSEAALLWGQGEVIQPEDYPADIASVLEDLPRDPAAGWDRPRRIKANLGFWLYARADVVNPAEMAHTFLKLLEPAARPNWTSVTDTCRSIASAWGPLLAIQGIALNRGYLEGFKLPEEFSASTWSEFWLHAQGVARERLSPSELKEYQEGLDRTGAEKRLSAYFFRGCWEQMPADARVSLVAADRNYYDTISAKNVLYQLCDASASLLRPTIEAFKKWLQANNWLDTKRSLSGNPKGLSDLRVLIAGLNEAPDLGKCKRVLWDCQELTDQFLNSRRLSSPDLDFVNRRLKDDFEWLWEKRNKAVHEGMESEAAAAEAMGRLLGIRQEGTLIRLIELSPRLSGTRASR